MVVHAKAMGPDFTFFVVYGPVHHLVDVRDVVVVERDYPLLSPKEVNGAHQEGPAPAAGRRRRLHRHRRPHRRHRRDPQHQGLRGGEGPRVLLRDHRGEPRRPGRPCPTSSSRRASHKADAVLVSQVVTQRDAHLHNTKEMSAAFREAFPADKRPLLVVGGPRFDELATAELGVDRIFGRAPRPARSRPTSCPRSSPPPRPGRRHRDHDRRPAPRRLRDPPPLRALLARALRRQPRRRRLRARRCSATSPPSCASAPTATRVCSPATTSVAFRAPVMGGDVLEATATVTRVGRRSRGIAFEARVVCRATPDVSASAADVLAEPDRGHDRHRHRRRPGLTRAPAPAATGRSAP